MKTDEEIGREAAKAAHAEAVEIGKQQGLTLEKVMQRWAEALDAEETKFFQHEGYLTSSENVVAHGIRLKAVELGTSFFDIMPSQKHEHNVDISGNLMGVAVQVAQSMKGKGD